MLEANIDDLDMKEKKIFVKGSPDKALTYAEIGAASFFKKKKPLVAHGYYNGPEDVSPEFEPGIHTKDTRHRPWFSALIWQRSRLIRPRVKLKS